MPTGTRNWWPTFVPPPVPIRQPRGPLSLQGGARNTGVRFCGGQTERTLRGEAPAPHFPESRQHSWKNKHLNAGCTTGPTAHSRHTEASPSPFLREKKHTLHTALAAAQACSRRRTGLGLSPTGSLPCWQHEETKTQRLSWILRH